MYVLPQDRMPEAEVSLRLAFHLLALPDSHGTAKVAIHGAQIRVHGTEIFHIAPFLADAGWNQVHQEGKNDWQGQYERGVQRLIIHARSGVGDVVAAVGGRRIRAECKGGPLVKRRGNPEYPTLRSALGQVVTTEQITAHDILVVAVPFTPQFQRLADQWRNVPLVARLGIRIALVGRDGAMEGLDL